MGTFEEDMRIFEQELSGEVVCLDETDPDLLAAASVPGAAGRSVAAVVALLRERHDTRSNLVREVGEARCRLPEDDFPAESEYPLASGVWGQIRFRESNGVVCWSSVSVVMPHREGEKDDLDENAPGVDRADDLEERDEYAPGEKQGRHRGWVDGLSVDEDDEGVTDDGQDVDEEGIVSLVEDVRRGWVTTPMLGQLRPDPHSAVFRRRLESAFAVAQRQILLKHLRIGPEELGGWAAVLKGNDRRAVEALVKWANKPLQREVGPAARWLLYLAEHAPQRHAALMTHVWAVPDLHTTGYRVLDATHPGWTKVLPGLAPPDAHGVVEALVLRGAGDAACAVLDALSPGWQAALPTASPATTAPR